jgi:membrane protein
MSRDPDWRARARVVVARIGRELAQGRISVMAGGVAFYAFLALFPALTALVSIYGLLADPGRIGDQMDALAVLLPQPVRDLLQEELTALAARSKGTLSLEVVVSIGLAMWAANKGTRTILLAVQAVFEPRQAANIVRVNFRALLLTVGAIIFGVVAVAALIALPTIVRLLGLATPALRLLSWLRWPVLAGVLLLGLAFVYRSSRAHAPSGGRWLTVGSALATAGWLAGSGLFSWSVATFTSHRLDGSIAAFAVMMTVVLAVRLPGHPGGGGGRGAGRAAAGVTARSSPDHPVDDPVDRGRGRVRQRDGRQAGQRRQPRTADPQGHRRRGEREPVPARDPARRTRRTREIGAHPQPRREHPARQIADRHEGHEHPAAATRRHRRRGGGGSQQRDRQQRRGQGRAGLGPQDGPAPRPHRGRRDGDPDQQQGRRDGQRAAGQQPHRRRRLPLLRAIDGRPGPSR